MRDLKARETLLDIQSALDTLHRMALDIDPTFYTEDAGQPTLRKVLQHLLSAEDVLREICADNNEMLAEICADNNEAQETEDSTGDGQMKRYFEYVGQPMLTRGEYGVTIRGGHSADDDPDALAVFDPDTGDFVWGSIEAALESRVWVEITREQWEALNSKFPFEAWDMLGKRPITVLGWAGPHCYHIAPGHISKIKDITTAFPDWYTEAQQREADAQDEAATRADVRYG